MLNDRSLLAERFIHPTATNIDRIEIELVELAHCECVLVSGVVVDTLHL